MDEYEQIAERLLGVWNKGDRLTIMVELDRLQKYAALPVIAIMANRMSSDNRERFIGFLVGLAISIVEGPAEPGEGA